jgi:hypothetical protein
MLRLNKPPLRVALSRAMRWGGKPLGKAKPPHEYGRPAAGTQNGRSRPGRKSSPHRGGNSALDLALGYSGRRSVWIERGRDSPLKGGAALLIVGVFPWEDGLFK